MYKISLSNKDAKLVELFITVFKNGDWEPKYIYTKEFIDYVREHNINFSTVNITIEHISSTALITKNLMVSIESIDKNLITLIKLFWG